MNYTDASNITDHPAYLLGDKVAEICKPLFKNFPINYFNYMRRYKEGGIIALTSNKYWMCHYVQEGYRHVVNGQKMHSWVSTMQPKAYEEAVFNFRQYNGMLIEKVWPDYIEALEFASPTPYTNPLEFCSSKDLLNQFFLYFKDKTSDIISVLEKEPMCFPESKFLKLETEDKSYSDFYQSTNVRKMRFKFSSNSKELFFTKREFEVLSLYAKGKSAKEVAEILQISSRTVETYLYNVKNRSGMFTTGQLIDNFAQSLF